MEKLPAFEPGDYALVAPPTEAKECAELVLTWTGPWQVVSGDTRVHRSGHHHRWN